MGATASEDEVSDEAGEEHEADEAAGFQCGFSSQSF